MDVDGFFSWLVPGTLTGVTGIMGFALKRLVDRIDDLEQESEESKLRHADFRGHVSEHYAKRADVQHSLDRIHTRLDSLPREIIDAIKAAK